MGRKRHLLVDTLGLILHVVVHPACVQDRDGARLVLPILLERFGWLRCIFVDGGYPIHPELFDRLYNDWSSMEEFQRTRGVLRLMASVIYTLWSRGDRSLAILPSLVPIDEPTVESELTRYLTPNWPVIIEKDVDGPNSLPARMDTESARFGRLWATRRVARTIYMGSAPVAGQANKGLDIRRVRLGCVQPGENIAVFGDALRALGDQAAHLYADGARYWYSTQPNVGHVARDRAAQQQEDDCFAEIRLRLKKQQTQRGGFAKIHASPDSTGDVPDETDGRLVILAPDKAHTNGLADSPAMLAAKEFIEKRGNSQRVYQNTIVFLAADKARLEDLRDACANYRAWKSILDEKKSLGLDPFNEGLAEKKTVDFDSAVDARLPETYQWILVPTQSNPQTASIEWQAIRLSGSGALSNRAFTRLEREGHITSVLGGLALKHELDKVLWPDKNHLDLRKIQDYFSRYLYLPRLVYQELIIDAVRDGVSTLTWRDCFAYAAGYDEAKRRYLGLQAGRAGIAILADGISVVVKPDIAHAQMDKEAGLEPTPRPETGGTTRPQGASPHGGTAPTPRPEEKSKPTRFHGSIEVDATRLARDAATISTEILQHLASKLGAKVQVVIDIQATIPDGVDENTVRTVTENCRTLGFDSSSGFES